MKSDYEGILSPQNWLDGDRYDFPGFSICDFRFLGALYVYLVWCVLNAVGIC